MNRIANLMASITAIALAGSASAADIDWTKVDQAIGKKGVDQQKTLAYPGTANGGVYQFSVPRAETISEGAMPVPPAMGTAIAINFEPTGGGKAAISGDFVLLGNEVNPVLRTLREHGIEVTALHSHMLDDSPHLFFTHFWATDDAQKLAHGLRAALDRANVKRGS